MRVRNEAFTRAKILYGGFSGFHKALLCPTARRKHGYDVICDAHQEDQQREFYNR